MFGPGKSFFEPLTVVHAALENGEEERAFLLDLLAHPYLDLVSVPFERHDRLAGWLLGLAHLTGMLFAGALQRSRLDPEELRRVASTTFVRQVATARSVLEENHALYFAIQRLNPYQSEVYAALAGTLSDLTGAVERGDRAAFTEALSQAATRLPQIPDR
jgi:prephenate dehydrogenase